VLGRVPIETRGLKKIQAICAVMHKLLQAIHAMLQTRTPFDGSRFYTPTDAVTDQSNFMPHR